MYGMPRDQRSRLQMTSYAGQRELYVEPGLDWQVGEMLVVAPTNMRTMDTDTCVIASANPAIGEIVCQDPL